jgi:hypothetical protein
MAASSSASSTASETLYSTLLSAIEWKAPTGHPMHAIRRRAKTAMVVGQRRMTSSTESPGSILAFGMVQAAQHVQDDLVTAAVLRLCRSASWHNHLKR